MNAPRNVEWAAASRATLRTLRAIIQQLDGVPPVQLRRRLEAVVRQHTALIARYSEDRSHKQGEE